MTEKIKWASNHSVIYAYPDGNRIVYETVVQLSADGKSVRMLSAFRLERNMNREDVSKDRGLVRYLVLPCTFVGGPTTWDTLIPHLGWLALQEVNRAGE